MNCPYCKDIEMEEDGGYSKDENCIYASYNCKRCKIEFFGVLFPQKKDNPEEGME